jgi:hypothetical protein
MEKRVFVLKEFVDKNNFAKKYKVGEELIGFDEARVADLVKRGLAEYEKEVVSGNDLDSVSDINLSDNNMKVIAQIKKFEEVEKLKQYLESEKVKAKPRASVVAALEARIVELDPNGDGVQEVPETASGNDLSDVQGEPETTGNLE